jgi:ectoine hydroxylase-related dioxygenase (phytanoyl-CoA dioxygenase family)
MNKVYRNDVLENQHNHFGYVKLSLENEIVEKLIQVASKYNFQTDDYYTKKLNKINVSLFDRNSEEKKGFFEEVSQVISRFIEDTFLSYEPVMINLWSKLPGSGKLEVHQNWTHVDERFFTSVSLWIPLQDTNRNNGTIEVVPSSHNRFCDIRGVNIDSLFYSIEDYIIKSKLIPIDTVKGEALSISDSIIHYSGPNNSDKPRNSIQVLLKPIEATPIFFVGERDTSTVHLYTVTKDFFFDLNLEKLKTSSPDNAIKHLGAFEYLFRKLDIETFENRMKKDKFTVQTFNEPLEKLKLQQNL